MPLGQLVHILDPADDEYEPGEQYMQLDRPEPLYDPDGQDVHEVEPRLAANVPAEHCVQEVADPEEA